MNNYNFLLCIFLIWNSIQEYYTTAENEPEFPIPERFNSGAPIRSMWEILIEQYNPINLGIGFPDYPPPHKVQIALANAATSNDSTISQYSPNIGHPRLLKAISMFHEKSLNRSLNPDNNILVTSGATEALYLAFLTHTFPGDEWILFEPFYKNYPPMIKSVNGIIRSIKLKPKFYKTENLKSADWSFDRKELTSFFNERTKGIVVNNPHNQLGKAFTLSELTFIADLAKKWKTLVVFDEAHQFSYFDNKKHLRIATLPGMFEQTISIGSAGKLFGATGYRIGWAYGDSKIISHLKTGHFLTVFCAPTPMQEATAVILEEETKNSGKPYSVIEQLQKYTQDSRDYLYRMLKRTGMTPILPEGSFFIVANWTTIGDRVVLDAEKNECEDYKFVEWFAKKVRVLPLPMSPFYHYISDCPGRDYVRFNLLQKHESYADVDNRFSPLYNGKF